MLNCDTIGRPYRGRFGYDHQGRLPALAALGLHEDGIASLPGYLRRGRNALHGSCSHI